jgi:hypothetical protein
MTSQRPDRPDRGEAQPEELRDWEVIQQNGPEKTERLMVMNGWLYRTTTATGHVAMIFAPETMRDIE